jgi:hypothetical protein
LAPISIANKAYAINLPAWLPTIPAPKIRPVLLSESNLVTPSFKWPLLYLHRGHRPTLELLFTIDFLYSYSIRFNLNLSSNKASNFENLVNTHEVIYTNGINLMTPNSILQHYVLSYLLHKKLFITT